MLWRKSINIKVADISLAEPVIQKLGIKEYKAYPNGDIQIFDNVAINDLIVAFNKENVGVIGINSKEESVEEYYLNLMKEGK